MPVTDPVWLDVNDVLTWLRSRAGATDVDTDLAKRCAAAAEPWVQRARPDQYATDPGTGVATFTPDAEVYQAAVMLAARTLRRRNSPSGIESLADSVSYVARYDPEIERALRQGSWTVPAVG